MINKKPKKPTTAELLERIQKLEAALQEAKAEIDRLRRNGIRNVNTNSFM